VYKQTHSPSASITSASVIFFLTDFFLTGASASAACALGGRAGALAGDTGDVAGDAVSVTCRLAVALVTSATGSC
jgi:hypothetical protein